MADLRRESPPAGGTVDEVVARMLSRNDWHLTDAATLSAQVGARLRELAGAAPPGGAEQRPGAPVERVVLCCYAELLLRVFAGHEGEERQRAAYHELLRYVYRVTHRYGPELGADEREEIAYIVVAELYDRCVAGQGIRSPGSFIAVALQQTRNTLRSWRSAARHMLLSLDEGLGEEACINIALERALGRQASEDEVYDGMERREQTEQVRAAFARAMERHPRARLQLLLVWLHIVEGLDYATIAARLGISIANARVLYSRGRSRLREDQELQALAAEW